MSPSSFSEPLDPKPTGWAIAICDKCHNTSFEILVDINGIHHYYCNNCFNEHKSTCNRS